MKALAGWLILLSCCLNAAVTSGVNLNFTADSDTSGDSTWQSNVETGHDFNFFTNVSSNTVTEPGNPGITKTYAFPTSLGIGGNATNLDNYGSSQSDATFEIWFKSDDHSGEHILYETGGLTDGFQISVSDNWIIGAALDDGDHPMRVAVQVEDMTDRHHQVVVTIDFNGGGGNISMYYDGQYAVTDLNTDTADFSGTGDAAIAYKDGDSPLSGTYTTFNGNISIFRYYSNKAFTAQEVLDNYNAISTATSGNVYAAVAMLEDLYVTWDAHDPGADPSNTWSSNEMSVNNVFVMNGLGDWTLGGGTKPVLSSVNSNNFEITQAYYFDGTSDMTMAADWLNTTTNSAVEIWFQPDDLVGDEILWEAGGTTDGSTFVLSGANLFFYAKDDAISANVSYDITDYMGDFIKASAFVDMDNDMMYLYLNGKIVDSTSAGGLQDYSGTDGNGLGDKDGGHGAALTGYGAFSGYISFLKTYSSNKVDLEYLEVITDLYQSYTSGLRPRGLIFSIE